MKLMKKLTNNSSIIMCYCHDRNVNLKIFFFELKKVEAWINLKLIL